MEAFTFVIRILINSKFLLRILADSMHSNKHAKHVINRWRSTKKTFEENGWWNASNALLPNTYWMHRIWIACKEKHFIYLWVAVSCQCTYIIDYSKVPEACFFSKVSLCLFKNKVKMVFNPLRTDLFLNSYLTLFKILT